MRIKTLYEYEMNTNRGLIDYGGTGSPILLLHGLMGRGSTWKNHINWLKNYGRVFTFDAAFHRGINNIQAELRSFPDGIQSAIANERFVTDLAEILHWIDQGPAIIIGHSMGGLHAWCAASEYPELICALVIEDMVPEFPGQSTATWTPFFDSWPNTFTNQAHAQEFFGEIIGEYFWSAFDNGALHGDSKIWQNIASSWGGRHFWDEWNSIRQPTLLIQGENGIDTLNLMSTMAKNPAVLSHVTVPQAGHLVHDDNLHMFRGAVEAFLAHITAENYMQD